MSVRRFGILKIQGAPVAVDVQHLHEAIAAPLEVNYSQSSCVYFVGTIKNRKEELPLLDIGIKSVNERIKYRDLPECSVAVLRSGDKKIGLIIERVEKIISVEPEKVVKSKSVDQNSLTSFGSMIMGDESIYPVLNIAELIKKMNLSDELGITIRNNEVDSSPVKKIMQVKLGLSCVGLDVERIKEVVTVAKIEKNVLATDYCIGLVRYRNQIIPVFHLRNIISKIKTHNSSNQLLIIENGQEPFAFVVDQFVSLQNIFSDQISEVRSLAEYVTDFLSGIVTDKKGNETCLLDMQKIIKSDAIESTLTNHYKLYHNNKIKVVTEKIESAKAQDLNSYLVFKNNSYFAVPIKNVCEVADATSLELSELDPRTGNINIRGEKIRVLNFAKIFSLQTESDSFAGKVIVVFKCDKDKKCGLLVDAVDCFVRFDASSMSRIPSILFEDIKNSSIRDYCSFGVNLVVSSDSSKCLHLLNMQAFRSVLFSNHDEKTTD